mmetsp:Transcript_80999/g.234844  ORF Transcript_80999/g.234844 Transcript_80999/m.234844 type:complete len:200 (+) Transcript_80999:2892-3491(+)
MLLRVQRCVRPIPGCLQGRQEEDEQDIGHEVFGVADDHVLAHRPALLRARLELDGEAGLGSRRPMARAHIANEHVDLNAGHVHVRQGAARLHQVAGEGIEERQAHVRDGLRCAEVRRLEGQGLGDLARQEFQGLVALDVDGRDEGQRGRQGAMEGVYERALAGPVVEAPWEIARPLRGLQARRGRLARCRLLGCHRALR